MKEPRKVRGLLDFIDAEASGEDWEFETPSADYVPGLGLGATKEARRWALLGYCTEQLRRFEEQLSKLKPRRGRPTVKITVDMKRAAAVLAADDFWCDKTGERLQTQKIAIELAAQIDKILCEAGGREKPLFGSMTTMKRFQDSVSKGLRELGLKEGRFLK